MQGVRRSLGTVLTAALVSIAALSFLSASGCGGAPSTGAVEVDQKQQRELHKLVTEDYGKMYKERYAGKANLSKKKK